VAVKVALRPADAVAPAMCQSPSTPNSCRVALVHAAIPPCRGASLPRAAGRLNPAAVSPARGAGLSGGRHAVAQRPLPVPPAGAARASWRNGRARGPPAGGAAAAARLHPGAAGIPGRFGAGPPGRRLDLRGRLGLPPPLPVPRASKLALPTSDTPVVSVVIPAYGQVGPQPALPRLAGGLAARPAFRGDPGRGRLRRPARRRAARGAGPPLRWSARATSASSARATTRWRRRGASILFLLNNDTEVMPGAIDALVDTLRAQPEPGLAGPARLLYPDGWLQEAGGIVWRDGSAWNWGNRQDPRRYEFTYLREADYVSGAAIMLPRAAWEAMGGFDEHYLPAYGEDTDLAFRLRAAGYAHALPAARHGDPPRGRLARHRRHAGRQGAPGDQPGEVRGALGGDARAARAQRREHPPRPRPRAGGRGRAASCWSWTTTSRSPTATPVRAPWSPSSTRCWRRGTR
jgi:hypothetical protein